MPYYAYAWAAGWGVALASLANVETDLHPYTQLLNLAPKSQPVDPYPVRTILASGRERGDGRIDHAWEMTLPTDALEYVIETKFALTSVASVKVTINTRRHEMDDYARYNAWLSLPQSGVDMVYLRRGVLRVTFRFTALLAL